MTLRDLPTSQRLWDRVRRGTVLAAIALASQAAVGEPRHLRREFAEGVAEVARRLCGRPDAGSSCVGGQ